MRALQVALTILLVASVGVAALPRCETSVSYGINDTSGTFGCDGFLAGKTVKWEFTSGVARQYNMEFSDPGSSSLDVSVDGRSLGRYTGRSASASWTFPGGTGSVIFTYQTDPSNWEYAGRGYGVTIRIAPPPTLNLLKSGQPFVLEKQQPGGFVYFYLPWYLAGHRFNLDVEAYSYRGVQPPGAFVSVNQLPSLEKHDYTNVTVSQPGRESCLIDVPTPRDGVYNVGVFLYGSAARLSVKATWSFKIPSLTSGVRVQSTVSGVTYYQLTVPVNSRPLEIQFTRAQPGGYPIAYITRGTVPSQSNYEWKGDTSVQAYWSFVINDPNPYPNPAPNPGNYIIAVSGSGGFIVMADW